MVSFADIQTNNSSLKAAGSGLVAAFLGATRGIGLGALKALTKHTDSPTIYVVGRSESKLTALVSELKGLNETASVHPIVGGDLTLVANAQKAASEIAKSADKLDLLVMSPGFISFSGPHLTSESLEACQAIRYYSRMAFLATLLPLLRRAPSPRVVSVLAGGWEGKVFPNDWQLADPKNFGVANQANQSASLTTLFFEQLNRRPENEKVVFIHIYPGLVATDLEIQGLGALMRFIVDWFMRPALRLIGYTADEAGERVVFAATSGRFRKVQDGKAAERAGSLLQKGSDGQVGSGVYLVQGDSSVAPEKKVLQQLRRDGLAEKVYEHTMQVFEKLGVRY